jgi:formate-dependent nitrite reductase membrane component NrfD
VALGGRRQRRDGRRRRILGHPAVAMSEEVDVTYYDVPVLKAPVWKWYIPAYFFLGGVAGASSTLASVARRYPDLRRRSRRLSLVALTLGAGALIADLGRPSRFANMLRVFRPTSPMSMGSWLLAVYGPAAGAAAVLPDVVADPAGALAGFAGLPLAGYTGALVAATSVPAWQEASTSLPLLFTASGVAGAASLLSLGRVDDGTAAVLRRYGIAGKAGELAASAALEREVGRVAAVARPYKEGASARLWQVAHGCTTASLLLSLPRTRSRWREQLAAVTGVAGSLLVKIAVLEAGKVSAADPRATFHLQNQTRSEDGTEAEDRNSAAQSRR